jgi:hypothetical protein
VQEADNIAFFLSFFQPTTDFVTANEADPVKLKNLVKQRNIYGDITHNVSGANKLEDLLKHFNNYVPAVIFFLKQRNRRRTSPTYIPVTLRFVNFHLVPGHFVQVISSPGRFVPSHFVTWS